MKKINFCKLTESFFSLKLKVDEKIRFLWSLKLSFAESI